MIAEPLLLSKLEAEVIDITAQYLSKFQIKCARCIPSSMFLGDQSMPRVDQYFVCSKKSDDCYCKPLCPDTDDPMADPAYFQKHFQELLLNYPKMARQNIEQLSKARQILYIRDSIQEFENYNLDQRIQDLYDKIARRVTRKNGIWLGLNEIYKWLADRVLNVYKNYLPLFLQATVNLRNPDAKKEVTVPGSFGCKLDELELRTIFSALDIKLYKFFVEGGDDGISNLINIFLYEITPSTPPVRFTCETTQLAYIMRRLEPHCSNLSFITAGQISKFYSFKGKLITAGNLSKSLSDCHNHPKDKSVIDTIIPKISKTAEQ